jgi:hypothetical protein
MKFESPNNLWRHLSQGNCDVYVNCRNLIKRCCYVLRILSTNCISYAVNNASGWEVVPTDYKLTKLGASIDIYIYIYIYGG